MSRLFLTLSFLLCATFSITAGAQEDLEGDAAVVTYDKNYFEKFAPVSLLDMLQRIPGVPEILDKNREQSERANRGGGGAEAKGGRGFGSGGDQILINGRRLAGKNNNIDDTLSRISAAQVEKVELIRGATSGLDVQSQGLVINVTMIGDASASTTFWKVTSQYIPDKDAFGPEFLVSHSGSSGNLQYMFSAEYKRSRTFFDRYEEHFNATSAKTGDKEIHNNIINKSLAFNSNISYTFESGAEVRLNGLFEPSKNSRDETQNEIGSQPLYTYWDTDQDFNKWEIGGDYSQDLGFLGNLKALFVINSDTEDTTVSRERDIDTSPFQYADETTTVDKSEKIFRASVTKSISESQNLEVGGEVAINKFDKMFSDSRRSDPADSFVLRASDNVKIKENRYEVFANHTYNFSSSLVLQSSLTTEFSKIVADSITTNTRRDTSFTYLKPRFNLRYDISRQDQIRLTAEKRVSQLNFNNFVTRFDSRTDQLVFGNTNIRPEQVWEFSAAFEHRLANDGGSLEAEVFYRDYNDHITLTDFSEYENLLGEPITAEAFFSLPTSDIAILRDQINFISKSGNVEGATAKGVKLKGNLRLGFIDLPQAVISLGYTYEKRREPDQFTPSERNFARQSDHTFTFSFRHDLTDYDFAYGFDGRVKSTHETFERNYLWPWTPGTSLKVFAEKTLLDGLKVRLEASQSDGGTGRSTLNIFYDHRRFDDLLERSEKNHTRPREIILSLQGTF